MPSEPIPDRQRWANAASRPMGEIASIPTPLLRRGNPIAVVGGKLAAALIAPLVDAGFERVATEQRHPVLAGIPPEAAEYEAFGTGFGEIHSARAFRQLVERAARSFAPQPDRRYEGGVVVDPFRPGLRYPAASDREFEVQAERHLNAVRSAFRRARTLLVALSSSEVWETLADGAVYPHWARDGERLFDAETHRIHTLTLNETVVDLKAAIAALRGINPAIEIVLMISPEPQAATALPVHVLAAGALGKAVLRIAMETVSGSDGVHYFPALEIATLVAPTSAYDLDGAPPLAVTAAVAEALVEIGEGGRVSYDGATAPISVMKPGKAASADPRALAASKRAPTRPQNAPQAQAVDAFSEAKAAEDAARTSTRAAKRAARTLASASEQADSGEEARARKLAERQARHQEKAAAREAKRAVKHASEASGTKTDDGQAAEVKSGRTRRGRAASSPQAEDPGSDVVPKRAKRARVNAGGDSETPVANEQPGKADRPRRRRAAKP